MIDIKDFPEGTKISILYTAPITDYYGDKLPSNFTSSNGFYSDLYLNEKQPTTFVHPFFIDEIDFSDIERWCHKNINGDYPSMKEDLVLNLPKIKSLEFDSFNSNFKTITLNCGDVFEDIYGAPQYTTTSSKPIFTLNSTSNKISKIGNFDASDYAEVYINCNCENLTSSPFNSIYSNAPNLIYHSGFPNCKYSSSDNYYYVKLANLTYESCISILNNLYDFTGNGVTPTSSQGKLKVHANFLTTVGDELSIGTNKGWTITA
jgi:hypothetical protein